MQAARHNDDAILSSESRMYLLNPSSTSKM